MCACVCLWVKCSADSLKLLVGKTSLCPAAHGNWGSLAFEITPSLAARRFTHATAHLRHTITSTSSVAHLQDTHTQLPSAFMNPREEFSQDSGEGIYFGNQSKR